MAGRFFDNDEIPKNFAFPSAPCPDVKWPGAPPLDGEGNQIPPPQVTLGPQHQVQMAKILEWLHKINVGVKVFFGAGDGNGEWILGKATGAQAEDVPVPLTVEVEHRERVDFVAAGTGLSVAVATNPPDNDHHSVTYTLDPGSFTIRTNPTSVDQVVNHGDTITFVEVQTDSVTGVTVDVAATDEVRLAHGNTSNLTPGPQTTSGKGINSITVDGMGHVTLVGYSTDDLFGSFTIKDEDNTAQIVHDGEFTKFIGKEVSSKTAITTELTADNNDHILTIGLDLNELPNYDDSKTQVIGHVNDGAPSWIDTESC